MKISKILTFLSLTLFSLNSFAQNPDDIINDYFTAIGGKDKIAQVKSLVLDGSIDVMGNSGDSKITLVNGKGYKSEITFNGQSIIQAVTDTGAWMINPMMGSTEATSIPQEQYNSIKDQIYIGGPLYNYKENGYVVKYAGTDTVDGKTDYKIEGTTKSGVQTVFYFDNSTHLLTQQIVSLGGQSTTIKFANYQKTDLGYLVPFTRKIVAPGAPEVTLTVSKATINAPVDPSIFKKP